MITGLCSSVNKYTVRLLVSALVLLFTALTLNEADAYPQKLWAVGDSGEIQHTSDGGQNWNQQVSNTTNALFDVHFTNATTGWAVGDLGTILHTTDGGQNWSAQTSTTTSSLNAVDFINVNDGWAVGDAGTALNTDDGGSTWLQRPSPYLENIRDVDFVTIVKGWVVGDFGRIAYTVDGGENWDDVSGVTPFDLNSVDFVDDLNGWAVGMSGTILHTSNGGATWSPQESGTLDVLEEVNFIDSRIGWAAGMYGTVLYTEDGGQTWTDRGNPNSVNIGSIEFVTTQIGWSVGAAGAIDFTVDGGVFWNSYSGTTVYTLFSVVSVPCGEDADSDGFFTVGDECGGMSDCNDDDSAINPGAVEIWYDGIDQDCDGWNDYDQDKDTYLLDAYEGNEGGTSPNLGDCDDLNGSESPGLPEGQTYGDATCSDSLDNDCDGFADSLDRACYILPDLGTLEGGLLVWTTIELPGSGSGNGVDVDPAGTVYVAGMTPGPGNSDFLNEYDSNGILLLGGGTILNFSSATDVEIYQNGPTSEVYYAGYAENVSQIDILLYINGSYNTFGTPEHDEAHGLAVDSSGNAYVGGTTAGSFGAANSGGNDIFVAKYDSAFNNLWTRQAGTALDDHAEDVALDQAGNVYVTGNTYGSLDGNTSAGNADIFLMKFDSNGNKLWTRQMGSGPNDFAHGTAVDQDGNIYVTGGTYGALDGNTSSGGLDIFLIKFDSHGNRQWTVQAGTSAYDQGLGITTAINGDVYITGETYGDLDGNWNQGQSDAFVMKFTQKGVKQWTEQYGQTLNDTGNDIAVNSIGQVYVTGASDSKVMLIKFSGDYAWSRTLGTGGHDRFVGIDEDSIDGYLYVGGETRGSLGGQSNAGGYDVFLSQYNSVGALQWTQQIGSNKDDRMADIAYDDYGGVYVAGNTMGGGIDGNTNADPGQSAADVFLIKYDPSGAKQWTRQFGTIGTDYANGIAHDSSGNIYVTGFTSGDLDGGGSEIHTGNVDIFLVKYDQNGNLVWIRQRGTTSIDDARGVAVDSNGDIYITGYTHGDLDGEGVGTNAGGSDLFLVKFDSSGNEIWTRQRGSTEDDKAWSVAVDGGGGVYVTGYTLGGLDGNTNAGPAMTSDIFLVSYNSAGDDQWTVQSGTPSDDFSYDVAYGGGNIHIAGYTKGEVTGFLSSGGSDIFSTSYDDTGNELSTRQTGSSGDDSASSVLFSDLTSSLYIAGEVGAPYDGQLYSGLSDAVLLKYDMQPPYDPLDYPIPLIYINNMATYANNPVVQVRLTDCFDLQGCLAVRYSNDNLNWSDPELFSETGFKNWDMTDSAYGGNGSDDSKTVYARIMDGSGIWSPNSVFDTITFDSTLPTGSLTVDSDEAYTNSTVVVLDISGSDLNGVSEMQFSNDNIDWSSPETFNSQWGWLLSSGDGTKTVYAKVKDNPGNWSDPFTDTIILDETAPATTPDIPGTLYQSAQTVTLTCDDSAGIGCADTYYCTGASCNPTTLYSTPFNFSVNTTLRYYSEDNLGNTETIKEDVYTFVQAVTTLSMELSAPRILSNGSVDAVGQLLRIPEDSESRNGLTVKFEITPPLPRLPWTTETTATYSDSGLYSHTIDEGFTTEGIYDIKAIFDGTGLLMPDESTVMSVYVGPSPGYAIIIEGKIPGEAGLDSHNKTTNRIYTKLTARGFSDSDIYYFNYDTGQSGVDEAPTKAAVQAVVEFWAKFQMNNIAAPLYVIMTDHGDSNDGIYLDGESITPADMNSWLTTLEGGLNAAALLKKRVVIAGACYSGAFIPAVSGSGRVVISSSAADEISHKGPYEMDGIDEVRSGEFFMEELFTFLERGYTLKDAFQEATEKTEIFTRRDSITPDAPPYFDNAVQHPHLDDDGDGIGSNTLSSTGDGNEVDDLYLGVGNYYVPNRATNPAELTGETETVYLSTVEDTYTMWADVNDNAKIDGGKIWYEVRKPSKALPGAGGNEQAVADYVYNFLLYTSANHWEKEYGNCVDPCNRFDEYGKYEIFYFVRDAGTQKVSPMKRSIVYRDDPANQYYPDAFNLTAPADVSEQWTGFLLNWEESADQDGDKVTYTVMISTDNTFATVDYVREGIKNSATFIGVEVVLTDQVTYYWKVVAIDEYGKKTESNQVWSFTYNDDPNPNPKGPLEGYVRSVSGKLLENAYVTAAGSDTDDDYSESNGYFILMLPEGSYTLNSICEFIDEGNSTSDKDACSTTGSAGYIEKAVPGVTMELNPRYNYIEPNGEDINMDPEVNQYQLTIAVSPPGNGSTTPDCTGGCMYDSGTQVIITASESGAYPLSITPWSSCDNPNGSTCTMTVDAEKIVTANYESCMYPAMVEGGSTYYYSTLQEAYDNGNTISGNTVKSRAVIYTGGMIIDLDKTLSITGGYDCVYNEPPTGVTTIQGDMTISDGEVTMENVEVE